jgi:transposase-like protein
MARKRRIEPPQELDTNAIMARFTTDEQAREYLESVRWQNGRYCPHCGNADEKRVHAIAENKAAKVRPGVYFCGECRQQFTVTVGTVFEATHLPLRYWLTAFYLLCTSKKGISALQIQRMFKIGSYRSAWHMMHRIRFAMKNGIVTEPLTGEVEVDETYIGARNKRGTKRGRPGLGSHKTPVVAILQRGGKVRSMHMERVTGKNLKAVLRQHVHPTATLMTDEYQVYKKPGKHFAGHETVNHGLGEYVRGRAHVNTAEGYFSLLKRGINGIYHHVGKQHHGQYLGEFDFRYNTRTKLGYTDGQRTIEGIRQASGKRLMLRRPRKQAG